MAELKTLDFNGTRVSFVIGERTVLVCATEIGKTFTDKQRPSRWLSTRQAKELLKRISQLKRIQMETLVTVRTGGIIHGTWMYADIAVAYATWLSPQAGDWCDAKIKELIRLKRSV